jgi:Tfp pilus assembly protein PilF
MDELTPEQLQELDTNIKGMLEGGGSQADVEKYATDYREFIKKKAKEAPSKTSTSPSNTTTPPVSEPLQNGSTTTPSGSTGSGGGLLGAVDVVNSYAKSVTPQRTVTPQQDIPVMSEEDKVNALKGIKPQSDLSPSQIEFKQKQNNKINVLGGATSPQRSNKDIQEGLAKLNQNPNDDNAIYQLGYGNLSVGDTVGAQSLFTKALEVNPANYKAQMGLGNIDYWNKDYESALNNYQSAMPNIPEKIILSDGKEYNNPDYEQNILQIGQQQTLLSKDKPELTADANKSIDYILSQDPNNYLANQLKAQLEKQGGNQKSADEYNNKALTDYVSQTPVKTIADVEAEWK